MAMRVHEIHPSIIHAPLVLLPTASVLDIIAATTGDRRLSQLSEKFWIAGTVSGLLAGLAGMAASQEVKPDEQANDMMYLHGIGNLGLVVAAMGVTTWRARNPASVVTGMLGLAASTAAIYTAYLGGEVVYGHGVGVKSLTGTAESPKILSAQAPATFVRDAVAGAWWLLSSAWKRLVHKEAVPAAANAQGPQTQVFTQVPPRSVPATEKIPPVIG